MNRFHDHWQRVKRWYVGPVLGGYFLITVTYILCLYLYARHNTPGHELPFLVFTIVMLTSSFGTCGWFSWVAPPLMARDRVVSFLKAPRKEWYGLCVSTWLPPAFALLVVAIVLFEHVMNIVEGYGDWPLQTAQVVFIGVFLAFALVSGAVALWLGRIMQRSMRGKAALLRICYECGYDVRDIPSATCPECGEPIPPQIPAPAAQPPAEPGANG